MNTPPYSEILSFEDLKFMLFPNDAITQHLKRQLTWEPHFKIITDMFINDGDTVIDCGANFGYNSVIMGKKIGRTGKLISFEPQNICFQQLNGNLILNNIFNSLTYKNVCGSKFDEIVELNPVDLSSSWVNIGDTSIGTGGESVKTITIDSLKLNKLNFIKIDVQGYEYFVLEGSEQTISKFKPDIFIEIEPHLIEKFSITSQDIFDKLKIFGYEIYRIDNEYPCDYICTINQTNKIGDLGEKIKLVKI
jgi:FkbM family methyltransferase